VGRCLNKRIASNALPGEEREYLLSIRRGERKPEDLSLELDQLRDEIEGVPHTNLSAETDTVLLNKWLVIPPKSPRNFLKVECSHAGVEGESSGSSDVDSS
jgi:hypothetical protein